MSKDLQREVMQDDERAVVLVEEFARKSAAELGEEYADCGEPLAHMYGTAMRTVLARAESPIERMLFGWLVADCAGRGEGIVVLDPPADADVLAEARRRREAQQAIRSVVEQVKRANDGRTVDQYIDWLEGTLRIDSDEADYWRGQWIGYQLHLEDAFHFVPNAVLPGHGANGRGVRADIWVFIPARPSFSVIIECDGYEWHGDKNAFTADRRRDRALRAKGYTVLRYSGSEIHSDPLGTACSLADELIGLKKKARKHLPPLSVQPPA